MIKTEARNGTDTERRKIRQVVRQLAEQGYEVQAEVRGLSIPPALKPSGIIPDIVATKNGQILIVEVKTPGGVKKSKDRLKALAELAEQRADVRLRLVVTKPRKE